MSYVNLLINSALLHSFVEKYIIFDKIGKFVCDTFNGPLIHVASLYKTKKSPTNIFVILIEIVNIRYLLKMKIIDIFSTHFHA